MTTPLTSLVLVMADTDNRGLLFKNKIWNPCFLKSQLADNRVLAIEHIIYGSPDIPVCQCTNNWNIDIKECCLCVI